MAYWEGEGKVVDVQYVSVDEVVGASGAHLAQRLRVAPADEQQGLGRRVHRQNRLPLARQVPFLQSHLVSFHLIDSN